MAMNSTKANKRGGMMYHHADAAQGYPNYQPLQTHIPIDYENLTIDVYSGRVLHINPTTKKLRLGCLPQALPFIAMPHSYDYDIKSPQANTIDPADDFAIPGNAVGKAFLALSCTGVFEINSTEYDDGVDEVNYAPNVFLTAEVSTSDVTIAGVLKPGIPYANTICGVVHKGLLPYGLNKAIKVLNFFTYFLPSLTQDNLNAIAEQTGGGPEGPVLSAVSGVTSTGMTINWEPVDAATRYEVELSASSSYTSPIGGRRHTPLYSQAFTGLTTGTTYYYRVRAVNGAGESTWVTGSQATS